MTTPKGKQRSIHMDDETFDTLERLAGEYKANNSTIVRMALIQFDRGGAAQRPTPSELLAPAAPQPPIPQEAPTNSARDIGASQQLPRVNDGLGGFHPSPEERREIVLPDPKVSSFTVSGGKVRGKVPRNDREDDGLDV